MLRVTAVGSETVIDLATGVTPELLKALTVDEVNAAGKDPSRDDFLTPMESGDVFRDIYNSPPVTFSPESAWPPSTCFGTSRMTAGWCRSATSRTAAPLRRPRPGSFPLCSGKLHFAVHNRCETALLPPKSQKATTDRVVCATRRKDKERSSGGNGTCISRQSR